MDLELNKYKQLHNFKDYFHMIINNRVESMIIELNEFHTTYLFSGILRNYFLEYYGEPRDLDIVVSRDGNYSNLETILKKYGEYKLNAFGGFKLNVKGLSIDIWNIEDTWAIKNKFITIKNKSFEKAILQSTFFNFSSILYNFKDEIFIYDQTFEDFYYSKTIDIVLENNLNELMCMINIIYYAEKYELNLSMRVKQYFITRFNKYTKQNYETIQLNHFKCIKYDYSILVSFYNSLKHKFNI